MFSRRLPRNFAPNEITRLLEKKRQSGVRIFDLTESNTTRVGLSAAGSEELRALADARNAVYEPHPFGMPAAREAIARYYAERAEKRGANAAAGSPDASAGGEPLPSPEDLVLTASTSEAYAHLLRLLCNPGDEILAPRPSYPLFEPLAAAESVGVETYRLTYDGRWVLDVDSLEAAISRRTRAVVVVQPGNPTGSCLSREEAERVGILCAERRSPLISDEVFGDFPRPPARAPLPSLGSERRALTFTLGGLSKLCGMPQMKLAWIALSGPPKEKERAMKGLEWIADLFLSVSTPVQNALPRLLEARHEFQRALRRRIEVNLARLHALGNERPIFRVLEAEGGWNALLSTPTEANDFALTALREHNVFVHPGHFYEIAQDACVVLSLLPDPALFEEAVGRLGELA